MTDHRTAIETHHREARIKSASTADEKKLAEVESAVIASKTALETEEREMRDAGKYADGFIVTQMEKRKMQSQAYIDKMRVEIVEPIAKQVESQARETAFKIPERTAVHIEASQHYAPLDSDHRQEAIGRAVTGKDDVLAVALLTGRDPITDITRDQLMQRLSPNTDQKDIIMKLAMLVQATLDTIKGAQS